MKFVINIDLVGKITAGELADRVTQYFIPVSCYFRLQIRLTIKLVSQTRTSKTGKTRQFTEFIERNLAVIAALFHKELLLRQTTTY